jgi:hypothetical protein
MTTYCGNYSNYQFGRTYTCKEGEWQCDSCKLSDAESRVYELENELEKAVDTNLDKIMAMPDEQVLALTRLEGSNPDDVAALARMTIDLATVTIERDALRKELEALESVHREQKDKLRAEKHGVSMLLGDASVQINALKTELEALQNQEPVAWRYRIKADWVTTGLTGCHAQSRNLKTTPEPRSCTIGLMKHRRFTSPLEQRRKQNDHHYRN